jgi:MFS family permease
MILFSSSFGGFFVTFMTSGINVGLPDIGRQFNLSGVYLNWISLSMVLVSAAVLLPMGRLADTYGRIRFFVGGMVVFSAASFACALAPSANALLAFRMVTGIGLAIGSVTAPALVILAYPFEKRGQALGWNVLGVYLGITVGPFLGGLIFRNLDWRAFFYILGAVNLVNVIIPVWKLRHIEWKEPAQGRFDLAGSGLFAVGLVCVLLGFSLLPTVLGVVFLPVGIVGLAGFVWWETRASDPLLPVRLLKSNRVFGAANAAVLINYGATAAMSLLMSYYLIVNRGLAEDVAGLVIAAGSLVQAVSSPFAGRLSDRVSARYVASSGMGLCVLGLFALIFLGASTPYWYIVLALCVIGLGFGLFSAPITHLVMGSVDRSQVGMASATMGVLRQAGMNLSIGVATMLIALYVGPLHLDITPENYAALRAPFLTTVQVSFMIFTALCALGIVASMVGPRKGESSRS